MRYFWFLAFLFSSGLNAQSSKSDWLIHSIPQKTTVIEENNTLVIQNGLLRRSFYLGKNIGCFDFVNLTNQQQLIRAIKPEARLIIDHKEYQIGGLNGQKENGYFLPEWLPSLTKGENDFTFTSYQVSDIKPGIQWKSKTWTGKFLPATGKELILKFESPINELKGLKVEVHYALYDGIPLIVKWLTILN
jgi:hypothetical protein